MTLKTPEQIADEICNAQPSDWAAARWTMKPEDVRASIIAAIEADRAQSDRYGEDKPNVLTSNGESA